MDAFLLWFKPPINSRPRICIIWAAWMAEQSGVGPMIRRFRDQLPTQEARQLLSEGHVAIGVL